MTRRSASDRPMIALLGFRSLLQFFEARRELLEKR
jgi:hypothetical protein